MIVLLYYCKLKNGMIREILSGSLLQGSAECDLNGSGHETNCALPYLYNSLYLPRKKIVQQNVRIFFKSISLYIFANILESTNQIY